MQGLTFSTAARGNDLGQELTEESRDVFRDGSAHERRTGQLPRHCSEPSDDLQDCILSVSHVSDSYAPLQRRSTPHPRTTSNAALRAYLLRRLAGDDTSWDFDVKIARVSESTRSRS